MRILFNIEGSELDVWRAARKFVHSRPTLSEAGEEILSFSVRHQIGWRIWIEVIHTGANAEILIAIADSDLKKGSARYLSGPAWECTEIIVAAVGQVGGVFEGASFYQRRALLMEVGKVCYNLISQLNSSFHAEFGSEVLSFNYQTRLNEHEDLLDVEWIEEIMNSKEWNSNA